MSTSNAGYEIVSDKKGVQKLEMVLDYNALKGGVDTFDKMVRHYITERRSNRWLMTIFCNILDVGTKAAYRLFKLHNNKTKWYKRSSTKWKQFIRQLALECVNSHIVNRIITVKKTAVLSAMRTMGYEIFTQTPTVKENCPKARNVVPKSQQKNGSFCIKDKKKCIKKFLLLLSYLHLHRSSSENSLKLFSYSPSTSTRNNRARNSNCRYSEQATCGTLN